MSFCGMCGAPLPDGKELCDKCNPNAKKKTKTPVIIGVISAAIIAVVALLLLVKKGASSNAVTPEFSADKGIDLNNISGAAWQVGGYNPTERPGGAVSPDDYLEEEYYAFSDGGMTSEKLNEDDVTCIVGYASNVSGDGPAAFGRVFGTSGIIGRQGALGTSKGSQIRCYTNMYRSGDRPNSDMRAYDLFGVELVFIDGFNYSGVTKNSSVNDIKKAGFEESVVKDTYFKIYSDIDNDWDEIDKEYDRIFSADVSNAQANSSGYPTYYSGELFSVRGIFADPMSRNDKQRDLGIGPRTLEVYNNMRDSVVAQQTKEYFNLSFEQTVKQEMAIAKQWNALNDGEIDYFALVVIEASDEESDLFKERFLSGYAGPKHTFSYAKNVCHVYLFSHQDTVVNWLEKWGL